MNERDDAADNWRTASRLWSAFGAPLRPSPEDVAVAEGAIAERAAAIGGAPTGVLLGVTPQLAECRWPDGTRLLAVDNSRAMIETLWPAPGAPAGAQVVCADWRAMPLRGGSVDVVVGDGGYAAVPLPADGRTMTEEIRRILRPGGLCAIRVYLRQEQPEPLADLATALRAGRIASVHGLKWRIAAAIQSSTEAGVRLADIWHAWQSLAPAARSGGERPGWRTEEIATLERYRDNATRYHFPTEAEFRAMIGDRLQEIACVPKSYEMGTLYPTFVLRRP